MRLSKEHGARGFDQIACVDFETFYSDEFSLRRMSNTEYVRDKRFKITAVGIQLSGWPHAKVYHGRDAIAALRQIDWTKTAFLAHHAHFDALIMTQIVGIKPCFYLDTLSMARAIHGNYMPLNLDALAKLYGLGGKVHKAGLVSMKGVEDMDHLPPLERATFIDYTGDDVEDTLTICTKMLEQYPPEELQLIDMTVRMFAEPIIIIDHALVWKVHEQQQAKKAELLKAIGVTDKKELSSNVKFVRMLEKLGVEVPMKLSPTAFKKGEEKLIPAVAMGDVEFKDLRDHPNEAVQALVEARIAVKSTLLESRSKAMIDRGPEAFPVYLKYCGAHTQRWSGGDGVNPQNLPRGSDLRRALQAPDGYMFNICDSAQIEARGNAWRAGQEDILRTFRAFDTILGYDAKGKPRRGGPDVYRYTAAGSIYGKDIELITDDERFVGKTCVLGLGYGMGYKKFQNTLKVGQFGPPVFFELEVCQQIVKAWRASNARIVQQWRQTNDFAMQGFFGGAETFDGLLTFERFGRDGYIHGPNGLYLRYHNLELNEEGEMSYETRMGRTKLYGGLLVENIIQWLSRIVIGEQMLQAQAELPMRIVTCTHDEIVGISKKKDADKVQERLTQIMSITPSWAEGWPLAAEGVVNSVYMKK